MGPVLDALRAVLQPWLGQANYDPSIVAPKLRFRVEAEDGSGVPIRLKVETNTSEIGGLCCERRDAARRRRYRQGGSRLGFGAKQAERLHSEIMTPAFAVLRLCGGKPSPWSALRCRRTPFCGETPATPPIE